MPKLEKKKKFKFNERDTRKFGQLGMVEELEKMIEDINHFWAKVYLDERFSIYCQLKEKVHKIEYLRREIVEKFVPQVDEYIWAHNKLFSRDETFLTEIEFKDEFYENKQDLLNEMKEVEKYKINISDVTENLIKIKELEKEITSHKEELRIRLEKSKIDSRKIRYEDQPECEGDGCCQDTKK